MRLQRDIVSLTLLLMVVFFSHVDGQTTRRKPVPKKTAVTSVAPSAAPAPAPDEAKVPASLKKNERPADSGSGKTPSPVSTTIATDPTYYYEFAQPEFMISRIVIRHDDAGKGTITFTKKLFDETVSDPVQISATSLERINAAFAALNFLDSNESYQYEKDYSHLGVSTFKLKRGGKERTTVFNFTTNKDAKALSDEYRKLGNQFIWVFDITVARENQPLESPKLMDALDSLIRRNEISDPEQMIPLLKGMVDDERIPLIARNHAGKLVERITKSKK